MKTKNQNGISLKKIILLLFKNRHIRSGVQCTTNTDHVSPQLFLLPQTITLTLDSKVLDYHPTVGIKIIAIHPPVNNLRPYEYN